MRSGRMKKGKTLISAIERRDLFCVAILTVIAILVGVYLISTAVLISRDGVRYISQAKLLSTQPEKVIKGRFPIGYPVMIYLVHEVIAWFHSGSSLYTWIYSAQGVTSGCRVISIIILYFIGKFLVGGRNSFLALLILIFLPYPAEYGSDVLRDWPYLMFVSGGFLLLLYGSFHQSWWSFGLAGFVSGLGYMIRPESGQILFYGLTWLLILFFKSSLGMSRVKTFAAMVVLCIGFMIPVGPYIHKRGLFLPQKVNLLISCCEYDVDVEENDYVNTSPQLCSRSGQAGCVIVAIYEILKSSFENLMYFYGPVLLAGVYNYFRCRAKIREPKNFFILLFIGTNVVILVFLYCYYEYISRRHTLPLVVFTIFYLPSGLRFICDWFVGSVPGIRHDRSTKHEWLIRSFIICGMIICLPKLLTPMYADKHRYKAANEWLKQNTERDVIIKTPDVRLGFYAERDARKLRHNRVGRRAKYVLEIVDEPSGDTFSHESFREVHRMNLDEPDVKKELIIYKAEGAIPRPAGGNKK